MFREFPGGPVVKTQCFHCQGPGSIPGRGNQDATSHMAWQINNNNSNVQNKKEGGQPCH